MPAPQSWFPRYAGFSARPMVLYTRYVDAISRDTVDLKWFRRLGRDPLERTISIVALSMGIVRSHMDASIDSVCVTEHGSHSRHAQ